MGGKKREKRRAMLVPRASPSRSSEVEAALQRNPLCGALHRKGGMKKNKRYYCPEGLELGRGPLIFRFTEGASVASARGRLLNGKTRITYSAMPRTTRMATIATRAVSEDAVPLSCWTSCSMMVGIEKWGKEEVRKK